MLDITVREAITALILTLSACTVALTIMLGGVIEALKKLAPKPESEDGDE